MEIKTLEKYLKALANKRRLAILKHLKKIKEATVGEISELINLSFKSTSRHLSVLFGADLVEREQRSTEVYYCLEASYPLAIKTIIQIL